MQTIKFFTLTFILLFTASIANSQAFVKYRDYMTNGDYGAMTVFPASLDSDDVKKSWAQVFIFGIDTFAIV